MIFKVPPSSFLHQSRVPASKGSIFCQWEQSRLKRVILPWPWSGIYSVCRSWNASGLRRSTKRNCLGDLIQSIQHVLESLGIWDLPQSPGWSLWNGSCCSPIKGWRWQRKSPLRWLLWGHGGQGMACMAVQRSPHPACNSPSCPFYRLHPPVNRDDHSFSPYHKPRAPKKEIQHVEPSHNTTTCSVAWMGRVCTRDEVCAWGFICWVPNLAKSLRGESVKKLEYQYAKRPMLVTYTELVPKEMGSYETVNLTS